MTHKSKKARWLLAHIIFFNIMLVTLYGVKNYTNIILYPDSPKVFEFLGKNQQEILKDLDETKLTEKLKDNLKVRDEILNDVHTLVRIHERYMDLYASLQHLNHMTQGEMGKVRQENYISALKIEDSTFREKHKEILELLQSQNVKTDQDALLIKY